MPETIVWNARLIQNRILIGTLTGAPSGGVLCFSMMAPIRALEGCKKVRGVGGYTELLIDAENVSNFSFTFEDDEFEVYNSAWLPAGAFHKSGGETQEIHFEFEGADAKPELDPQPSLPMSDGLRLVPNPNSWTPKGGVLNVTDGFKAASSNQFAKAFESVAALAKRNDFPIFSGAGRLLNIDEDYSGPDDGYRLITTPEGVRISAANLTGAFYGCISLLNLLINHDGAIPCGKILDSPRFSWRGQHLDCARHFYQPDTLLQFLDLLALLKLNRFHWHFHDDESFRLEIESFPQIWQKTRLRGEGQLMASVFGGGHGPTGGSYSLEFTKHLIARAAELQIEVLPEIEIPSHAYTLNQIFPQLRDSSDNTAERSVQGYLANTMNPAMPFTWKFISELTAELAGLFPFAHIHIGCDERPPEAWRNSPAARDLMVEHGLETLDDLQGWMIEQVAGIVVANGCRPCAWEEAVKGSNGGIGNDAILFSWTGQGPGLEAARNGYKVVMCPAQNVYFDMAHSEGFNDPGARWARAISLIDTVDWHPVPLDEPELEENILGVEGAYWGEFTLADGDMWTMVVPRILGLSEMAWRQKTDPADADSILQSAADNQRLFDRLKLGTP